MAALIDSQEENPEVTSGSQDLYEDPHADQAQTRHVIISNAEIMAQLKKMDSRLDALQAAVSGLTQQTKPASTRFNISTSVMKKKLNIFLKNKFSKYPWLEQKTDTEYKNEVKRLLQKEGFGGDVDAYKTVGQWTSQRFTDFRNQLRRKIITEVKEGTRNLNGLEIKDFARLLLGSFCDEAEDVCSTPRIQFALVMRSFLHKKRFLTEDSDTLECYQDFWITFKGYFNDALETGDGTSPWPKMRELDEKRRRKYLSRQTEQN